MCCAELDMHEAIQDNKKRIRGRRRNYTINQWINEWIVLTWSAIERRKKISVDKGKKNRFDDDKFSLLILTLILFLILQLSLALFSFYLFPSAYFGDILHRLFILPNVYTYTHGHISIQSEMNWMNKMSRYTFAGRLMPFQYNIYSALILYHSTPIGVYFACNLWERFHQHGQECSA